jgi:hypothetical protein
MGFANAGIFDDIGNGIAGAADDVAGFTVNTAEDTADLNYLFESNYLLDSLLS